MIEITAKRLKEIADSFKGGVRIVDDEKYCGSCNESYKLNDKGECAACGSPFFTLIPMLLFNKLCNFEDES